LHSPEVKHLKPTGKSHGPVVRSLNLNLTIPRSFEGNRRDRVRILEKRWASEPPRNALFYLCSQAATLSWRPRASAPQVRPSFAHEKIGKQADRENSKKPFQETNRVRAARVTRDAGPNVMPRNPRSAARVGICGSRSSKQ
jgi:hypothetical protein